MGATIYFYFYYYYPRVWYNTCHMVGAKNECMLYKHMPLVLLKPFYSYVFPILYLSL